MKLFQQIWSPFCAPGMADIEDQPRKMFSHQQYINLVINTGTGLAHDYTSQSTDEDPRMIAFFDSLVQREVDRSFSDSDDSELSPDTMYLNFAAESESSRDSESESSISSFQASLIRMSEAVAQEEEESGNSDSNVMLLFSSGKRKKDEESGDGSDDDQSKKKKDENEQDRQGTSTDNQSNHHSKPDTSSGAKRKRDTQSRQSSSDDTSSSDESLDIHESRIKSRIMRRLASRHKRLKDSDGEVNSHRFRRMQSQLDHDRMINLRQRWAYCKALKARMAKSQEEPRPVVRVPNEDNLDIIAEHLDRSASREQRAALSRLRKRVIQEESVQEMPQSQELSQTGRVPSSPVTPQKVSKNTNDNTQVQNRGESSKGKPDESSNQSESSRNERCHHCSDSHSKCQGSTSTVDNANSSNPTAAGGSGTQANEDGTGNWKDFKRFKNRITRAKSKRQYRSNSNAEKGRHEDDSDSD